MFSLKLSDANDPQGLMRRKEPNKQTNSPPKFLSYDLQDSSREENREDPDRRPGIFLGLVWG